MICGSRDFLRQPLCETAGTPRIFVKICTLTPFSRVAVDVILNKILEEMVFSSGFLCLERKALLMSQTQSTIGYLGPEGSFSHEFALSHFGSDATLQPVAGGFDELISRVVSGEVQQAVLPVCNSNGSNIEAALRALGGFLGKVTIQGMYPHVVVHNLVVNDEFQVLKVIKTKLEVYSQCKAWLAQWDSVQRLECSSTSDALMEVRRAEGAERKWSGAICNRLAVEYHGGNIRYSDIQDPKNVTLFAVITSNNHDIGLSQVLICLTCSESAAYAAALEDFANAGFEFMHGTLKGAFAPDVPLWIEFARTPVSKPVKDLLNGPDRHFLGSFDQTESFSAFITEIFDDLSVDEASK